MSLQVGWSWQPCQSENSLTSRLLHLIGGATAPAVYIWGLPGYLIDGKLLTSYSLFRILTILPCCCCCCSITSVVSDSMQPHRWQPTQAPPSLGLSRQGYWSGLPFPSPGKALSYQIKVRFVREPGKAKRPSWTSHSPDCLVYSHCLSVLKFLMRG